jgi:hypothetical protein
MLRRAVAGVFAGGGQAGLRLGAAHAAVSLEPAVSAT